MKTYFWPFFSWELSFFTPTFWPIFQIFHAFCLDLGFKQKVKRRRGFCLNYDQSIRKTLKKTCFSNILKKNIIFVLFHGHFCSFTGIVFCFFSRASIWVSRARFDEKFHVHFCVFTCTFLCFLRFFHGHEYFFHGEKKNTGPTWLVL